MKFWLLNTIDCVLARLFAVYRYCQGYRLVRPKTKKDIRTHDQLVQRIFFKSGIFDSPNTELTKEVETSICQTFLMSHAGKPIAAMTVVENQHVLPCEQFFNVNLPASTNRSNVGEVTRNVIEQEHHQQNPVVALGMLTEVWRYATRERHLRHLVFCAPSLFLWGMQQYFPNTRILEQHPLTNVQVENRKGREAFFDESRNIRVVLVDLAPGVICKAARIVIRRRLKRDRQRRRGHSASVQRRK